MKISKGGQVSIPARIRHRWATSTVTLEDRGDTIVLEPAHDDPIAAAEGALAVRSTEVLDPLFQGALVSKPLDFGLARRAAEIRARHYDRSSRPISLPMRY